MSAGTPADPCDVDSSTSRTDESRADARRGPSPAERRGAPHSSHAISATATPQHPINGREAKPWTAGTIRDGQLMPKREDLQMKHRA